MNEKSIEADILSALFSFYPEKISFIPADDPFKFLVTVILSASSTDVQALKSSERLFSRFNGYEELYQADVSEIEDLIRSSGLVKNKARTIKAVSAVMHEKGALPETVEELTAITGIGEKTANCYLGDVLKKPAVIVDTHFLRVANRLGLIEESDRNRAYRKIREKFPSEIWTRLSMTVNLHGRTYCKAKKPLCGTCPLKDLCPSKASLS